jgi:cobalt-zinc-cadmium resistance protein CzcA
LFSTSFGFAQNPDSELDQLISNGIKNNKGLKGFQLQVDKMQANMKSAYSFDKTNVYYNYDKNNIAFNNEPLKVIGIMQRFAFPTVYAAQRKVYESDYEKEKAKFELQKSKLALEISKSYNQIVYWQDQEKRYHYLDSLYQNFSKASDRRFELGETNYLEKITAQAKYRQIKTKLVQIGKDKKAEYEIMAALVQTDSSFTIKNNTMKPYFTKDSTSNKQLHVSYLESVTNNYKKQIVLQKQHWLPDINVDYFRGTNKGLSQSINGFQVGVSVPILFGGNVAKSKVAQLELKSWQQQRQNEELKIDQFVRQKKNELEKYQEAITYYNQYGKKLSDEIIKVANASYKQGEIDFFQYILSLENATTIQIDYLDNVLLFNKTQLDSQYINIQNNL